MKVALMVPVVLRATVSPLALISPALKLIVEVVGLAIGSGPRYTAQEYVELTTVTLPVTAVAPAGMGLPARVWLVTANVAGVLATSLPERPLPDRLSSRRVG